MEIQQLGSILASVQDTADRMQDRTR